MKKFTYLVYHTLSALTSSLLLLSEEILIIYISCLSHGSWLTQLFAIFAWKGNLDFLWFTRFIILRPVGFFFWVKAEIYISCVSHGSCFAKLVALFEWMESLPILSITRFFVYPVVCHFWVKGIYITCPSRRGFCFTQLVDLFDWKGTLKFFRSTY